jgi:hypothetical protein
MPVRENLETEEMLINIAYGNKIMHVTEEDILISLTVIR